jgi:hypothetical protein
VDTINNRATRRALARRAERKRRLLSEIIELVKWLMDQKGVITKKEGDPYHCSTTKELKNFLRFSFYVESGQTVSGGETVKIWYRQDKESHLVLDVHWNIIARFEVRVFDEKRNWSLALKRIIIRKNRILEDMDKEKKATEAVQAETDSGYAQMREIQELIQRFGLQ